MHFPLTSLALLGALATQSHAYRVHTIVDRAQPTSLVQRAKVIAPTTSNTTLNGTSIHPIGTLTVGNANMNGTSIHHNGTLTIGNAEEDDCDEYDEDDEEEDCEEEDDSPVAPKPSALPGSSHLAAGIDDEDCDEEDEMGASPVSSSTAQSAPTSHILKADSSKASASSTAFYAGPSIGPAAAPVKQQEGCPEATTVYVTVTVTASSTAAADVTSKAAASASPLAPANPQPPKAAPNGQVSEPSKGANNGQSNNQPPKAAPNAQGPVSKEPEQDEDENDLPWCDEEEEGLSNAPSLASSATLASAAKPTHSTIANSTSAFSPVQNDDDDEDCDEDESLEEEDCDDDVEASTLGSASSTSSASVTSKTASSSSGSVGSSISASSSASSSSASAAGVTVTATDSISRRRIKFWRG